ncbi:MAG: AAA family ATPase, partial [Actinomycetota bacterium]|nr:AAA family ATPase [Actinomycetota bacterium]
MKARALVLNGTIGAGKTSLAEQVSELLHESGLVHGLIDLDWLAQVYPAPDPDDPFNLALALDNLAYVWSGFRRAGAAHLVMAATIETAAEMAAVKTALAETDVTVALVTASPDVAADRIRRRELGGLAAEFVERTGHLAARIRDARLEDFVVSNDDEAIRTTAAAIVERLGWLERRCTVPPRSCSTSGESCSCTT